MVKVLVLNGAANDASSWYRANGVFPYIEGVEFIYSDRVDWSTMIRCDIVFCPRPYTQNMVSILKYAKLCKKSVWISLDDDHFNIHPSNPAYKDLANPIAIECHKECIRLADVVDVTTQALKDVVLEHCPEANVVVIPNAANDHLFDLTPSYHERNKTILIRGGGSHEADIEAYKEPILKLIADYPDYKWVWMGYIPRWIIDSGIENDRLLIFPYTDLMKYFEILMELRPEIMIVPLEDSKFNKSKSNIAWIEGALAGAAVISLGGLPEFERWGCLKSSDLEKTFKFLSGNRDFRIQLYESALNTIPRLSQVNELRRDLIEKFSKKRQKFTIKNTLDPNPATDLEFFNVCLTHGHLQDNKSYEQMHRKAVQWLKETLDPKTVVEFGSGPGATIEYFHDLGIPANGLEINPLFKEYFVKRNPELADYFHICDFTNTDFLYEMTLYTDMDLGISIEVFEHIKMKEVEWERFIEFLSNRFKHFYFSSTPFRDNPSQDLFWGHKNIRTTTNWIKLFEQNGWELVQRPKILTSWDLLFRSKNV